ncbi:helix-turn-helix domain-containing protein [Vibrio sonorensis]|uniref:helix-turn-helix domain-containing protein n=1 Tax=Vibrio sonorensis TaxID=1004316 RepID=UPI0008DAB81A|nr:AraC family transcriptional regulator [Vibrio sonorensis]
MDVLHKGYWIGQSISFIPRDTLFQLEKYFHIIENGHDVSVLSEPDIRFCFFFIDRQSHPPLLLTAIKLCQNLNRKLVIIHKGELAEDLEQLSVVFDHFDLEEGDISDWAAKLSNSIHFHLVDHKEIVDIHKNKTILDDQNISKDLLEILKYIENNLSKTIREEDIADYCHYSVTYFSKLFHRSVGMSFRDYLTSKRIGMAKQMLLDDRKAKIAVIAFSCGYKDVSYFSRIFKKKTGLTPAVYRQLH